MNPMNTHSFLSHRLFVAAVSSRRGLPSTRTPSAAARPGGGSENGAVPARFAPYSAQSRPGSTARQLLTPAAATGF